MEKFLSTIEHRSWTVTYLTESDWLEIGTNFLNFSGDGIIVYVKEEHNDYIISDDGYTLNARFDIDDDVAESIIKSQIQYYPWTKYDCGEITSRIDSEHIEQHFTDYISLLLQIQGIFSFLSDPKNKDILVEQLCITK